MPSKASPALSGALPGVPGQGPVRQRLHERDAADDDQVRLRGGVTPRSARIGFPVILDRPALRAAVVLGTAASSTQEDGVGVDGHPLDDREIGRVRGKPGARRRRLEGVHRVGGEARWVRQRAQRTARIAAAVRVQRYFQVGAGCRGAVNVGEIKSDSVQRVALGVGPGGEPLGKPGRPAEQTVGVASSGLPGVLDQDDIRLVLRELGLVRAVAEHQAEVHRLPRDKPRLTLSPGRKITTPVYSALSPVVSLWESTASSKLNSVSPTTSTVSSASRMKSRSASAASCSDVPAVRYSTRPGLPGQALTEVTRNVAVLTKDQFIRRQRARPLRLVVAQQGVLQRRRREEARR